MASKGHHSGISEGVKLFFQLGDNNNNNSNSNAINAGHTDMTQVDTDFLPDLGDFENIIPPVVEAGE
ncbi:hypothetical protein PoB_005054000 [Plakobranchus ocellatus]|uniref:Uncharacterized protein n=1 Tax=Plakobranchus ocellatus TaxID=259542 RepID=A0AAV4BXI7_9GAST|nr:hypothetical protein PoB_005054000 [Plakobranchus ocellatus]